MTTRSEWVSECCISINIYNLFSTASSDWSSIVDRPTCQWTDPNKMNGMFESSVRSFFPFGISNVPEKEHKMMGATTKMTWRKKKKSVRQRSETHTIAVQSPLGCTTPPFDHGQTNDGRSIVRYIHQLWIYSKMIGHYLINSIRRLSYLICIPDILRVSGKCIGYYRYYLLGIKAFQIIKWPYNKQLLPSWTA